MEQTVAVNLNTDNTINVVWGECADINLETALKFIKSGEKEINNYVKNSVLPSLKEYADTVFTSENNARIWADGNDDEVQSIGGTRSAMASSGLSFAFANAPEDTLVEEWFTTHEVVIIGEPAKINGHNAVVLVGGSGIVLTQDGATITLSFDGYTKSEIDKMFGDFDVYTKSEIDEMLGDVETLINAL